MENAFRGSGRIWLITYKDRIDGIENCLLYFTRTVRHILRKASNLVEY